MKPAAVLGVILNTDGSSELVCKRHAAVFLVDTTELWHPDYIKADLIGLLKPPGQPIRYFEVERSPDGLVISAMVLWLRMMQCMN